MIGDSCVGKSVGGLSDKQQAVHLQEPASTFAGNACQHIQLSS